MIVKSYESYQLHSFRIFKLYGYYLHVHMTYMCVCWVYAVVIGRFLSEEHEESE